MASDGTGVEGVWRGSQPLTEANRQLLALAWPHLIQGETVYALSVGQVIAAPASRRYSGLSTLGIQGGRPCDLPPHRHRVHDQAWTLDQGTDVVGGVSHSHICHVNQRPSVPQRPSDPDLG
jgi:hypothetical protein